MKVLCVAEKPSISKSITQILSGGRFEARNSRNKYIKNYDFAYQLPPPLGGRGDADFTVTAVLGHLTSSDFDDDHRRWQSCDPFALFDARIITQVSSDLKAVEKNLQQEARNADLLLIWTDCDREGEHIGSEVADVCRRANPRIRVKRARFSAIIAGQIHDACRNANDLDMRQAMAVEARIALDLRIGAAFTRFATMSLQARIPELSEQTISYGPCQFPTLGFVVDQYNKVQNFVSEPFWYINVAIERENEVDPSKTDVVEFKWRRNHLFDLEVVTALYENCVDEPMATVLSVDTKPTTKWKPLPLTTVELQQSGSRLLHMTPKRILDIAEKLYQKGFLSYPRTETDQYDKAFDFMSLIQKQTIDRDWGGFAARLIDGEFQRPRNGRKNDKAHPPIHPTAAAVNLEADERRVYELVTRRFLASCHSNAEGKQTTVEIEIAEEKFFTTGLVIIRRNYLEVYPYDKWSDSFLPDFQEGEQFIPSICELKDGKTTAPNLLTEADLVGLMDKNGIGELVISNVGQALMLGTDATIAEHIAKIIERQYVTERPDGRTKYLVPSPLGIGLVEGFNAIGFDRSLSKPHLRAETEARMQLICDGARQKGEVLDATIDEYKEVYVKARREFTTVVDSVNNYMHGQGAEQEALRAAARGGRGGRGARGARGGRGGGGAAPRRRNDDDDADEDDSDGGGGSAGGGGAVRGGTRATRARGTTARGRSGRAAVDVAPSRSCTNGDQDDSTSAVPECACGSPAVPRTVSKPDSAHAGRGFWTCARPQGEQCGFFEWRDDDAPQAGPSRLSALKRATSSRPAAPSRAAAADEYDPAPLRKRPRRELEDEEGTVRCDCGLEANFATVAKAGPNKGRSFWGCPNNPRSRCKFFEWADEADAPEPDRYASSSTRGRAGAKSARGKGKSRATGSGGGGPAGGGQTCYKCGEEGHWANSCPGTGGSGGAGGGGGWGGGGADGGAGGSDQACFKCGQPGHWANACPGGVESSGPRGGRGGGSGPVDSGITECFKCGGTGHFANRCTNEGVARGRPAQKSTPGDGRTCFNCNGEGHWSSECTVKGPKGPGPSRGGRGGRATAGGAAGGSDDSCFKCGRPGHWASNCTNA